jgi:hypothetical protein
MRWVGWLMRWVVFYGAAVLYARGGRLTGRRGGFRSRAEARWRAEQEALGQLSSDDEARLEEGRPPFHSRRSRSLWASPYEREWAWPNDGTALV